MHYSVRMLHFNKMICLNKLLFHEQILVLHKLPKHSLSLIKADLFIVLLWQWPHHHSPKSFQRVERAGHHLPLHLCVQEYISGELPHRRFTPASNTTNICSFLWIQKVRKKETPKQSMPNTANISIKWQSSPACSIFNSQWHLQEKRET